jgi:hypothetical protein
VLDTLSRHPALSLGTSSSPPEHATGSHKARATEPIRGGARVGGSVSSVNVTLFSILVLRPLSRLRPTSPSVRTWIHTPTPMPSLYGFKPHLDPSKGAARRGVASRSQTTESAAPAASVCSMACFMASHACLALPLPLPLLSRVALLPNPTPIAHTGTVSTFDSLSPHLIGGLLELFIEAGE